MIVPLAPGGSTDVLGRIMAQAISVRLGQPVVVENVAGAAGTIGVTRAERSKPDGYTLLWGMWGTNMANGAIYNLGFDLLNDFEPIALVATQPFLIDARKTMPANNLKELVAWLKANADKATMGTSGVGSPSHVAGVLMEQLIGVKWQMIPYRSAGLATQDLLAGTTDLQLDTPAVSLPHVQSGALKAYAVTAKERIAVAPDIPTADEAGLPGFYFSFWHAMWAPKGTPPAIIKKVNDAVMASLADPDRPQAPHRSGADDLSAGPRNARSAARLPEGRDREVVPDHQGRRHQAAVIRIIAATADRLLAWSVAPCLSCWLRGVRSRSPPPRRGSRW